MKFLVDDQLPPQLAVCLRQRGHDCVHVFDLQLDEADDLQLWTRACRDGSALVSKDEDFLLLAQRPEDTGRLVWVRLGNCRNAALIEAFDRIHDDMILAFQSGQRIVEVR